MSTSADRTTPGVRVHPFPTAGLLADAVPDVLTRVLRSLGRHDPATAAAFAPGTIASLADSDVGLPPAGRVVRGPIEAASAIAALDVEGVELLVCVVDGDTSFAELRVTTGSGTQRSLAVAVTAAADDRAARTVLYTAAEVDPPTPAAAPTGGWAAAAPIVGRYFELLEAGEFEDAAACFSVDCLYSHPPYGPGQARIDFPGRAALLDGWVDKRGRTASRHAITRLGQSGRHGFLEGTASAPHIEHGTTFLSSFSIDADGLIDRYIAYYSAPAVPAD